MRTLQWIGASNGSGAQDKRTARGPAYFFDYANEYSPFLFANNPPTLIREEVSGTKLEAIPGLVRFNTQLAKLTRESTFPVVIGGDHACAIGTWSGISEKLNGNLGLLWIDAHMDAHTMQTSPSKAVHGMPVATLLGQGSKDLTNLVGKNKIDPRHLVLFGIRSYEPEEKALLQRLGVRVFLMEEIRRRGFAPCWREAIAQVTFGTSGFGITLDLDAIDPIEAPGVGSPAPNGLRSEDILSAIEQTNLHYGASIWSGIEIVEFNPSLDIDDRTCEFIHQCALHIGAKQGLKSPTGGFQLPGHERKTSDGLASARPF